MTQLYENYFLVRFNPLKPMHIPAIFSRKHFLGYIIVISLFRKDAGFLMYQCFGNVNFSV